MAEKKKTWGPRLIKAREKAGKVAAAADKTLDQISDTASKMDRGMGNIEFGLELAPQPKTRYHKKKKKYRDEGVLSPF